MLQESQDLENALRVFLTSLRDHFNNRNLSHLYFRIEAHGRPTDDLSITFRLGEYDYGTSARSGHLYPTINEFFRRHTWESDHAALCLPAPGSVSDF